MTGTYTSQRVVLLTNFVPPYRVPLFRELADRVAELHLLLSTAMEPDRTWRPDWSELSVTLQRTLTITHTRRHPQGFTAPLYMHVPYDTLLQVRRLRPDVIISGELGLRTLQAVLYRRACPTSRVIAWVTISEHTEQGRGLLRRLLRRWLLRHLDAVIVNGSSGARYLQDCGLPADKLFCLPNPTDAVRFDSLPLHRTPEQAHRLLYVGHLAPLKGIDRLLPVLAQWAGHQPARRLQLWLAGSGPLRAALEQIPLPANLSLRWLGAVPYALLPQVYAQAGLLVFPTLADTWGLVVNEALAAGLPVLGSRYSQAVGELVADGVNGWTFRPDAAGELEAALQRALDTPIEQLARMRQAARTSVQHITPAAVAEGFVQAIRHVA